MSQGAGAGSGQREVMAEEKMKKGREGLTKNELSLRILCTPIYGHEKKEMWAHKRGGVKKSEKKWKNTVEKKAVSLRL
jgi:hypothetical protein